ncbi:MAG: DUF1573 domain-containing protein [Hyphomicrobiales bacterium]
MGKKVLSYCSFILFAVLVMTSCNNGGNKISTDIINNPITEGDKTNQSNLPKFKFEETTHDFGEIIQGEKVSYSFKYTNTGDKDLLISSISTSCGCTATEFSKDPIAPGKTGAIKVSFDSDHRKGFQNKSVRIMANTQPNLTVLSIKAQVVRPESM